MPEDQKSSFSEAVETGASAAHTIRGAIKTGKAISSAAKGAAAGGPYGAVAGAVWAGRKHIGKIIVAVIALLMLPVLFVLMLPGLIFGGLTNAFSPSDPEIPILNSETAIIENANEITFTLNGILGEALEDVLARIEADFAASGADHMEVKNAYSGGPIYNANLFISQYCAAKDKDFESISLNDLAATLRENKQHLYSYTSKQEIRENTMTDPETGEETTVSETWMVYTVRYNGESYFSDVVFQLTDDQKELASDYASNLSLFLGDGLLQNLEAWTGNSITALGDVTFTDGITPVVYYNQLDERYAGKAYGTDNIGGYGCGPTAIIVDIFNSAVYKNANMSILGTSGAGKTFTMQLMALRMRRKNIPIFIVAPLKGHEFHRACSNVGGSFIQISPASPHCINVMEIRRVDRSVNELLDGPGIQLSELAAKIQQLHIFFSLLIPDMSHEERQLLDEALVRTYNTKGITHDNASLEDPAKPGQYREMPVLGDLYEILKTSKETMRMAHILNRLVNGSASTFNKQTNVRLDNKYTVLDISSLTGDLLTVGMFVALDFVWDRAKADRTEEKAIFIDECWQLLSGAGAAGVRLAGDFLLEIAKTIRGYGGASIFASQDLADFFDLDGGRFGKGIINNSKTKIILNLEDDEAQRVQEALHLSDAETMEITHFERGHGLISTNNNNIMVEFKASPLEKDLITTDRRELREIVERKRREQSTSAEQQI